MKPLTQQQWRCLSDAAGVMVGISPLAYDARVIGRLERDGLIKRAGRVYLITEAGRLAVSK